MPYTNDWRKTSISDDLKEKLLLLEPTKSVIVMCKDAQIALNTYQKIRLFLRSYDRENQGSHLAKTIHGHRRGNKLTFTKDDPRAVIVVEG